MSARTPFIPSNGNPRPASRATNQNAGANVQFIPDRNNPLHKTQSQQTLSKTPSENDTTTIKPLNLNGLLKKKPSSTPALVKRSSASHRVSGENSVSDQAAENARQIRRDQASTPSLIAPKPLVAAHTASPLFSTANPAVFNNHPFKTPALPGPHNSPPGQKDTHVTSPDNQASFGELDLSMSLSGGPPQRILLDEQTMPLPMLGLIPKHRNKRGRVDFEGDNETRRPETVFADGVSAKRYKAPVAQDDYIDEIECIPRPSFSPQPFSSPIEDSQLGYQAYQQSGSNDVNLYRRQHSSSIPPIPPLQHPRGMPGLQGRAVGINNEYGTLDKLLGCQADAYVENHMDRYEEMASKWKECTMDEWIKGADEIISKYSKIMDFVKEHMSSKLKLFSSFDAQVDAHNVVLTERAKVLDETKKKLVTHSGDILG